MTGNNGWFIINDFDEFVDHTRSLVFKFFAESREEASDSLTDHVLYDLTDLELDEMNRTLSFTEAANIIRSKAKQQINKNTKEIRYCITDSLLTEIIEELNSRMLSNILNKLVNDGLLETAYDEEQDDFVFWVKDNDQTNEEKPETD